MSIAHNPNYPLYGDNEGPWVEIDGLPFPLTAGSLVEVAPLNPFSPSNVDGNSQAVVSQRHAVQIWDDLTGGIGFRDDDPASHQVADGTLDMRQPDQVALPPLFTGVGTGNVAPATSGFNMGGALPVQVEYAQNVAGAYAFFAYYFSGVAGKLYRYNASTPTSIALPAGTNIIQGYAQYNGAWWFLTQNGTSGAVLLKSSSQDPSSCTFPANLTVGAGTYRGLVAYDNKLITYDVANNAFLQYNSVGPAWAAYITGFQPLPGSETVRQLFVWTDKSGGRDALYCLTTSRILVYDEDGQQWEELYNFATLWSGSAAIAHVNRRDNSLVVSPYGSTDPERGHGNLLLFTPGTVDNIPINKMRGIPDVATGGLNLNKANFVGALASSIHWLYAASMAPTATYGGVWAFNEFGGWTPIFDAGLVGGSVCLLGMGYGGGKMFTLLENGNFYIFKLPDKNMNHPDGSYDNTQTYTVRSARVWNKQRNLLKLGSHFGVTFKEALPATSTATLSYRTFDGTTLSAWSSPNIITGGSPRYNEVSLNVGAWPLGVPYLYIEWQVSLADSSGTTTPVLESVALYYTYWQQNHFSYQFVIDLSTQTWDQWGPEASFGGYTRAYLQQTLLTLIDNKGYHKFTYATGQFTEVVIRADLLLSRREQAEDGSGFYSLTVRDLEN